MLFAVVGCLILGSSRGYGQACCSAGPPILGSLELPAARAGVWQFVATYEANMLNDVVFGSQTLDDNTRRRTVHSLLLESSYGLTSEFSVTMLFSLVRQERTVRLPTGEGSFVRTTGLGDAVVLVKYTIVPLTLLEQRALSIGLGTKVPLGSSSRTDGGFLLPADMQPGSGAWDGIAWLHASQGFLPAAPVTAFAVGSYRWTGTNHRFGAAQQGYRFGNEAMLSLGAGLRTDWLADFSFVLRLRQSSADRFGGGSIPNTGGIWLSVIPGLNVKVSDRAVLRTTVHLPVYRELTGTQLTTTAIISGSLFLTL